MPGGYSNDLKVELWKRYDPIMEDLSVSGTSTVQIEAAFWNVEKRRRVAAQQLRAKLEELWSPQLGTHCPLDLLRLFQQYVDATFTSVGEECVGFIQDPEAYGSFLHLVENTVLEAMLPEREGLKQQAAEIVEEEEEMAANPVERDLKNSALASIKAEANALRESSSKIQNETTTARLYEMVLERRIIKLDETFSSYEARCHEKPCREIYRGDTLGAGDWEHFLEDSFGDELVRYDEIDQLRHDPVFEIAMAFRVALRSPRNREQAKNFWAVGLKPLRATLLSAWRSARADSRASRARPNLPDTAVQPDNRKPESRIRDRQNANYKAIDDKLREIAAINPTDHAQVFEYLEGRLRIIPNAEPFRTAGGWMKGFKANAPRARSWLSKRWSKLGLSPFPRGPKKLQ